MRKWLNEWLFAGTTASTVLMSISTANPEHPLALAGRTVGYGLAALSILAAALAFWVHRCQARIQR